KPLRVKQGLLHCITQIVPIMLVSIKGCQPTSTRGVSSVFALPNGIVMDKRTEPTYVDDLDKCPKLSPRTPTSVHDLRPDDISVTMALGDSISAGAFSHGLQEDVLTSFAEYRGDSFANGGNPGAITIPNVSLPPTPIHLVSSSSAADQKVQSK
ncbi:1268_t:CDS:2, partial [Acaulospora colombiana]